MPKAEAVTAAAAKSVTLETITAVERRMVEAIKRPFSAFVSAFATMTAKRIDVAAEFMGTFNKLVANHPALSFVGYVRMLDGSVPFNASGANSYKDHKAYNAALYIKRLAQAEAARLTRGAKAEMTEDQVKADKDKKAATDALARAIATILQIAPDREQVWRAVSSEFGLVGKKLTNLQARVEETKPLFTIERARPIPLKLVHMTAGETAASVGAALNQAAATVGVKGRTGRGRRSAAA